ncbi:hypothetical protein [Sulfuriferula thiophila]|uniref:hypothetical protein n=1 Tax=Sulfuriferula thiophila TaxID=1781211 RepID=UPI000F60B1CB|nr:hypothetical protein [Sulfuriferula thiophila]
MAIGLLAVLQLVPWGEVISNAPKVLERAKKLWNTVANQSQPEEVPPVDIPSALSPEAQSIIKLQAQLAATEAAVADLRGQMLTSSELIQVLADQNAQLIKHVETNRVRILWLAGGLAVMSGVAVVSLAILLLR